MNHTDAWFEKRLPMSSPQNFRKKVSAGDRVSFIAQYPRDIAQAGETSCPMYLAEPH